MEKVEYKIYTISTSPDEVVELDCSDVNIFHVKSIESSGNWIANLNNFNLPENNVTNIKILISQDENAYVPNEIQINGVIQEIYWKGGSSPIGTNNSQDIIDFIIFYDGESYEIIGSDSSYKQ